MTDPAKTRSNEMIASCADAECKRSERDLWLRYTTHI